MKTLYVADLDGTLLNSKGQLSDFTKSTLNSLISHGLNFTVNTSRTPKSAEMILKDLKLKLPAIMMNGSAFYCAAEKKILEFFPIPSHAARKVCAQVLKSGGEPFLFGFDGKEIDVIYSKAESILAQKFIARRQRYYRSFKKCDYISPCNDTLYIICVGDRDTLEIAKEKIDSIRELSSSLFISDEGGCYLEIYSALSGKWMATKKFMEIYGFDKCVCFGDNLNDIEMLKNADFGICVANGYKEAKLAADLVIESADNDSVAKYLMIEWSRSMEL